MVVYRDDVGPDSMKHLTTEIRFIGVAYVRFIQDDFLGIEQGNNLYDVSGLDEAGFSMTAMNDAGLVVDGWCKSGAWCLLGY